MKVGFIKALAFTIGTSLMFAPVAFSVSGCGFVSPAQQTQAEKTVALLIETLQTFGVINTKLSNDQINVLVTYLDGTTGPDINVIMSDLQNMGVLAHLGLTTDQVSAIVALLQSMGYLPSIAGQQVQAGVSIKKK